MASEDNVRCLRYLYLLGEGVSLAFREIIVRETSSRSQSLDDLLSENRYRFRCLPERDFRLLFPNNEKVNTEIESWDLRVLFHVIKTLFWQSLTPRERSAISTFHSYREDVDPTQTAVMENDYRTIRADLRIAIGDIIQGLDATRSPRLCDIVNRSGAEDLNIQQIINRVRELNEFPDELLNSLERRFGEVHPSNVSRSTDPSTVRCFISKSIEVEEFSDLPNQRNIPISSVEETSNAGSQNSENIEQQNQEERIHETSMPPLSSILSEDEITIPPPNMIDLVLLRDYNEPQNNNDESSDETNRKTLNNSYREAEPDTTLSPAVGVIQGTTANNTNDEGNVTLQSVIPSNEDDSINRISGMLHELMRIQQSLNERRSDFWQRIDMEVDVESDTSRHADTSQTELIRTVNGIIRLVNIPEVLADIEAESNPNANQSVTASSQNLLGLENPEILNNSLQETERAIPFTGQQLNTPNAIELSSLTGGNQTISTASNNLIIQRILRNLDMPIDDDTVELVTNVLSFLIEIYQQGNVGDIHIMCAGEGCVVFMIRCTSLVGISNFLKFFKSNRFQFLLHGMSMALEQKFGNPVTLSPYIPEESLRNLE